MGYPYYNGYYDNVNCCNHNEYASKGVAGTGLGLGIAGTALALLNGGVGNLLGMGNCGRTNNCGSSYGAAAIAESQLVSQLQAENAGLKAERYSDNVSREAYQQSLRDNKTLRDEIFAYVTPLAQEAADNRVTIATLQAEQKCSQEKAELREQIMAGKINELALTTKGKFDSLDNTLACLAGKVSSNTNLLNDITKVVIPKEAICPEVMVRYNNWVAPTTTTPATA